MNRTPTPNVLDKMALLAMAALMLAIMSTLAVSSCASANQSAGQIQETSSEQGSSSASAGNIAPAAGEEYAASRDAAAAALADRLYGETDTLYVYRDFSDTTNHFTQRAKIFNDREDAVRDLDENCLADPHSGTSCIRAEFDFGGIEWGGWMFLSGVLPEGSATPQINQGDGPGQGIRLTDAKTLQFYAKGEQGGECIEFFTCGFGYDGSSMDATVPYPDSAYKRSTGIINLTDEWALYEIPLDGADLSNIANGFGFVGSCDTTGFGSTVFYLDDIRFVGDQFATFSATANMMRSYDTDSPYIKNAAFSYDNALVAMALMSAGYEDQALTLLTSFVYAIDHDRYLPGRVRNAYAAGQIEPPSGWCTGALLPGWYDPKTKEWQEDRYQVGVNVGNTSYVALALLQADAASIGSEDERTSYRRAATQIMDWVLDNCQDGTLGFIAGYDGWTEGENPQVYPLTYKSVEHNIDAYAAFKRLYEVTSEQKYRGAADNALAFIESMYDPERKLFYTGTTDDGHTVSKDNIVLDAQVWSALSLGDKFAPYEDAIQTAKAMSVDGAYPFNQANANGGWWSEGTAFTALTLMQAGEDEAAKAALDQLKDSQLANGLFPGASVDDLSTGIDLFTGEPWVYGKDACIAPTAWYVLADIAHNSDETRANGRKKVNLEHLERLRKKYAKAKAILNEQEAATSVASAEDSAAAAESQ